jgi:hypothetical protein
MVNLVFELEEGSNHQRYGSDEPHLVSPYDVPSAFTPAAVGYSHLRNAKEINLEKLTMTVRNLSAKNQESLKPNFSLDAEPERYGFNCIRSPADGLDGIHHAAVAAKDGVDMRHDQQVRRCRR